VRETSNHDKTAAMKAVQIALLVALLGLSACASKPKRNNVPVGAPSGHEIPAQPEAKLSPRCEGFCKTIRGCAAKAGHEDLADLMCGIARCETGNKCTGPINSPGRRYRGAFQFSPRSWRGLCGPVFTRKKLPGCKPGKSMYDVCCASICTAELLSQGGIGNWPACGKKASD
jgi:hypothetical protein